MKCYVCLDFLLLCKDYSNTVSRVSIVAFAVKAIKRQAGSNDLNSCIFENHTLKAVCLRVGLRCPPVNIEIYTEFSSQHVK